MEKQSQIKKNLGLASSLSTGSKSLGVSGGLMGSSGSVKPKITPLQIDDLTEIMDSLSIESDEELKKAIDNGTSTPSTSLMILESVFLSCKVKKFNKFDWKQERTLVITEKSIYSFKGKSTIQSS